MFTILSIDLIRQWWSTWPGLLKVVSTRRRSRRQSRASTAALESRTLLVGTVTSTFVNGSLTLRGDDAANDITVLFLADQVTIVGNEDIFGNKTVIAGVTSAKVIGTLTIDLGLGSDVATLKGPDFYDSSDPPLSEVFEVGRVRVMTGDGWDQVNVFRIRVKSSLEIDTGKGNDQVSLDDLQTGSLTINTSSENDTVTFGGITWPAETDPFLVRGNLSIDTGDGRDEVTSFGDTQVIGTTLIRTGSGADFVELSGRGTDELSRFRNLQIETGSDEDSVILTGIRSWATTIDTSTGNDRVRLGADEGPNQTLGTFMLKTGDGSDLVFVGGLGMAVVYLKGFYNDFAEKATFNMGNGSDTLQVDTSGFAKGVDVLMGEGKDTVEFGKTLGALIVDGPTLFSMGNNNDTLSIGMPGVLPFPPEHTLLVSTHLNGPVTIRGGTRATTVDWHSDNASFNGGLKLIGAKLIEHKIDRSSLLDSPRITVSNQQTGTFKEETQRTFVTNYIVTRDAHGTVSVTPVLTTINTGITLKVKATVSADQRFVIVDLEFVKTSIAEPVATRTINTPLGPQTIDLPVVTTIEVKTRVTIPDGGTVQVTGIKKNVVNLANLIAQATGSSLTLVISPRIVIQEEEGTPQELMVQLDLQLIEQIDRNILPGGPYPGDDEWNVG